MKFCSYCARPHEGRGRCCCASHARRVTAHVQSVTAGRNRARDRMLARQQTIFTTKRRWRDVAMGRDVDANLAALFGTADAHPVVSR